MKKFVTLLLLCIGIAPAVGAFNVTGVVTDSIGEPEAFATVRVYAGTDTVHAAALGTADVDGLFDLPLKAAGKYRALVTSVGRQPIDTTFSVSASAPTANLGRLIARVSATTLAEVSVVAAKPLVSKEIDRIGYDVQADEDSKTLQLDEMLKRVPLVSVDPDGTIRVKGSTSFKVYKNGRPNNSMSRNAKEIFKAIPASMIKKIEVITDPGAREDAEGTTAILNIVTVENTMVKGAMGNADINWNTNSSFPNASLWLSSQVDKVTLSAYVGYSHLSRGMGRNKGTVTQRYTDLGTTRTTEAEQTTQGDITWFGLEGSWEPDTVNLVTAEFGGYYYNLNTADNREMTAMTDATGALLSSYTSTSLPGSRNSYFDINGSVNYQHSTRHRGETITLSYMISTTSQHQTSLTAYSDMFNMPVPYSGINNRFKLNFIEHTGQADWERPLGAGVKLNVGGKYIYRHNHSLTRINYIDLNDSYSNFYHLTQVGAIYADARYNYKRFGARAGVRYEYSRLSATYRDDSNDPFGSNLSDVVPNAAVSYNLNDRNTFKLGYSMRISRPGISYLNPAVNETPTTVSSGNPNLGSAHIQELSLNYSYMTMKVNLDLTAAYRYSTNAIISINDIIGDVTYSTYANQGRNRDFYLSAFARWNITPAANLSLNASVTNSRESNPTLGISNTGWEGWASLRYSHNLPWKLRLNVGFSSWLGSSDLYSVTHPDGWSRLNHGIGLQRSFLKEDRLTVRVMANNPFGPAHTTYSTRSVNLDGLESKTVSHNLSNRNFVFSIGYRFGTMTTTVRKVNNSITNNDLDGRKN